MFKRISFIFFLFLSSIHLCAQLTWTSKNPFLQKVFIENKGQFNEDKKIQGVKYAITNAGSVQFYFTNHGLTYKYTEAKCIDNKEGKEKEETKESVEEEKERAVEYIPHYVQMKWIGANPNVQIIAEDSVSFYFTYGNPSDKSGKSSIKATAYKKIIYKNIYPNIDVEYTFPEHKEGVKYAIILHPGADVSIIKMNYEDGVKTEIDKQGNLILNTSFGNIIDHAPFSFYKDNNSTINSSFYLNDNNITFKVANHSNKQTVIIDPWTTVPAFTDINAAFDVDYDLQGNVYAYGGIKTNYDPYQEIKFNNTGTILWIFTQSFLTHGLYGDFAIDANSGSSYIVQPLGAQIIKLNTSGAPINLFLGDTLFVEMWRIVYDNCNKQLIIGGAHLVSAYQMCIIDTNFTSHILVDVLSSVPRDNRDIALLAIDNSNNCYISPSNMSYTNSNILLKCPANTLLPIDYIINDNHKFEELVIHYSYGYPFFTTTGFNGIAVNNNYLYTYDGSLLQRWNKNTGGLLNSNGAPPASFGSMPYYKGAGIGVDNCDNIYVGKGASINIYDTTFTLLSSIPLSDTIFDLKVIGNRLYACGQNFVSYFELTNNACSSINLNVTATNSCSIPSGSASVNPLGGNGNYNYLWNPGGQTTATAIGLAAGTYTVAVTDASCVPQLQTATVTVLLNPNPILTVTGNTEICKGQNTTLTANGGNTYVWSAGGVTTNAITISPTNTTTYTVTCTDSNSCVGTSTVNVTVDTIPVITTNNVTICSGNPTTITASGASTYTWNPTTGLSSTTGSSVIANPDSTTNYSVIGINGTCSNTATLLVTVNPTPLANAGADITIAIGNSTTLSATGNGTYSWNPTIGLNCDTCQNPIANPSSTTNYCVTISNANGCSATDCITVTAELHCGEIFIPTAFSPDNNGANEMECVYGKCIETMEFSIYDRWGEKVFETSDPKLCWDGLYHGKPLNTAVFVYYFNATLITGEKIAKKGNITLVR